MAPSQFLGGVDVSSEVLIDVIDSGDGIPPHDLPFIFDPYYQANTQNSGMGSGLDLAIVKRIVVAHGGEVSVKSKLGQEAASPSGCRSAFRALKRILSPQSEVMREPTPRRSAPGELKSGESKRRCHAISRVAGITYKSLYRT